jgi:rhodanese-related sulfurtransferase
MTIKLPDVPGIQVEEVRRRLRSTPAPFVLDVREPWEYAQGHLPGAHLVPLSELETRLGEIPRDRPILSVCQMGQRSLTAAGILLQLGYADVVNVEGGTSAWVERGFPVER